MGWVAEKGGKGGGDGGLKETGEGLERCAWCTGRFDGSQVVLFTAR